MEAATKSGAGILSDIVEKVAFANYLPLLTRATAEDYDATPGYMLEEIKSITFHSNHNSQKLSEYLNRRLEKPSACVKMKVLKIIHHLIQNGHPSFTEQLRKSDGSLKMATMYNGLPDPLLGSSPYEAVRIKAQEVLETLFDPALIHDKQLATAQEKSKLQLGGLGSSGTSAGKYEGFGSSPVDKKESIKDKMINMFTKFLNPPNETEKIIRSALTSSTGDYTPVSIVSKSTQYVRPNLSPTAKSTAKAKAHVPGKAAGGWESEDEVSPTRDPQGSQSGRTSSIVSTDSLEKIDSLSLESSDERRLVIEFCNLPRVPLSWSEIEMVGSRAVSMSIVDVLKAINDVLTSSSDSPIPEGLGSDIQSTETASPSDVKQIRALFIVEWFLHTDHISPAIVSQILHTNLQKLSAANNKVCPALWIKAKKVRLILGKLVTPDKKIATLN